MESMVKNMKELDYYRGKKVLVTGHTGFKGSWLSYILLNVGAEEPLGKFAGISFWLNRVAVARLS